MKITDIKAYAFWVGIRNACLVKVETDEGVYGWGESGLSGRELAVMGAVQHFREFLVGKDPRNIGALWQEMYRSQYFEGGRVLSAAIAAIDIALHDLVAKNLEIPVYQLLGGQQRKTIPLFATSFSLMNQELIDDVLRLKAEGWTVIRTTSGDYADPEKPSVFEPRESIVAAAEVLTEARKQLGNEITFGVDYHHRLSVAETISFVQRMPEGTLDFLEEPIRDQSPAAYRSLKQACSIPLAIGEEFTSKWDFAPYVEEAITNFGRIDVCNAGGFTEAMKIAAMCELHYIDMMPHNPLSPICTAASIHFCAAAPNLAWLEHHALASDTSDNEKYFINAPKVENNVFTVSDAPGLGVDVREEQIKDLPFKPWEPPRFVKRDGSYTNW